MTARTPVDPGYGAGGDSANPNHPSRMNAGQRGTYLGDNTCREERNVVMKRLMLLGAVAVGYVFGTRAGRQRYEQLKRVARTVKDDPRVQDTAQQAADLAVQAVHQTADVAREQVPVVKDKVSEVAGKVRLGG